MHAVELDDGPTKVVCPTDTRRALESLLGVDVTSASSASHFMSPKNPTVVLTLLEQRSWKVVAMVGTAGHYAWTLHGR